MAVREYIGARYVPLFDGHWDVTKNYEPLTIVDDANGNSYTSRRDVPAGTPLNNTEYWVMTSTFSGAVTQLQNRVSDVENDVTQLAEDVNKTAEKISEYSDLYGKTILFLGDSYTRAAGIGENERFASKIARSLGMEYFNWAVGSVGFMEYQNDMYIQKQFETGWASLTDDEKKNVRLIVIVAGRNDAAHFPSATLAEWKTTFYNLFNSMQTAFNEFDSSGELWAKQQVFVAPMLSRWGILNGAHLEQWVNMVNALAESSWIVKANVIPKPWQWCVGRNDLRLSDNAHFNADGHNFLTHHLLSAINGCDYQPAALYAIGHTTDRGVAVSFNVKVVSGIVYIDFVVNCANATSQTPGSTNLLDGATIPQDYIALASMKNIPAVSARTSYEREGAFRYSADYSDTNYNSKAVNFTTLYPLPVGTLWMGSTSFPLGI